VRAVFWQNTPSPHQQPALRELANRWPAGVRCVFVGKVSERRRRLGWSPPDLGTAETHTLDADTASAEIEHILEAETQSIHVFSGFRAYPLVDLAFRQAVAKECPHLGIMTEAGIRMGWRGVVRPLRSRIHLRGVIKHITMLLTMGSLGVDYYRSAGVPGHKLYPFMYQAEPLPFESEATIGNPIRFVYLGQYTPRKGVDLLLRSLARVSGDWKMTFIGSGRQQEELQRMATTLGIARSCTWLPARPAEEARQIMAEHDVAVVPSRFDGWGVVTNEAIQAGLAVVITDRCGSRDIVRASGAGVVVPSGSVSALRLGIESMAQEPASVVASKSRARAFASHIDGRHVADYLAAVLRYAFFNDGPRPMPPWQTRRTPDRVE